MKDRSKNNRVPIFFKSVPVSDCIAMRQGRELSHAHIPSQFLQSFRRIPLDLRSEDLLKPEFPFKVHISARTA